MLTKRAKRLRRLKLNINENNVIIERREFDVISYRAILNIDEKMFYYNEIVK